MTAEVRMHVTAEMYRFLEDIQEIPLDLFTLSFLCIWIKLRYSSGTLGPCVCV
jgi:hypothetical protein